jgi:hypothetical protein
MTVLVPLVFAANELHPPLSLSSAASLGDDLGAAALAGFAGWPCGPVAPHPPVTVFQRVPKTGSSTLQRVVGAPAHAVDKAAAFAHIPSMEFSVEANFAPAATRATAGSLLALAVALTEAAAARQAAQNGSSLSLLESPAGPSQRAAVLLHALRLRAWAEAKARGVWLSADALPSAPATDGEVWLPDWVGAAPWLWSSRALRELWPQAPLAAAEGAPPSGARAPTDADLSAHAHYFRAARTAPRRVVFDQHGPVVNFSAVLGAAWAAAPAAARRAFTGAHVADAFGETLTEAGAQRALVVPAQVMALRDPFEREASHFYYVVDVTSPVRNESLERRAADPCGCPDVTFDACVAAANASGCPGNQAVSTQTLFLCGASAPCVPPTVGEYAWTTVPSSHASKWPGGPVPGQPPPATAAGPAQAPPAFVAHRVASLRARYAPALHNLRLLAFVGVTEELDLSVAMFSTRLPDVFPPPRAGVPRARVTLRREPLAASTRAVMEGFVPNQYERMLYAHVRRYFWEAVWRCGVLERRLDLVHAYEDALDSGAAGIADDTPSSTAAYVLAKRAIEAAEEDIRDSVRRLQAWDGDERR